MHPFEDENSNIRHCSKLIEIVEALLCATHGMNSTDFKFIWDEIRTRDGGDEVYRRLLPTVLWARRKSFLCVLHAAGLLDLTGRARRERAQRQAEAEAAAAKRRGRKRPRQAAAAEAAAVSGSSSSAAGGAGASSEGHGPPPLAAMVFANLHKVITDYL